jgi:hypothetical protein
VSFSRYKKSAVVGQLIKGLSFLLIIIIVVDGIERQYQYFAYPEILNNDKDRYNFNEFENSPTIKFIRTQTSMLSREKNIYSNAADLLYMFGYSNISELPLLNSKEEMKDFLDADYVIWLNNKYIPGNYLSELNKKSIIKPLYTFADGVIFIINNSKH